MKINKKILRFTFFLYFIFIGYTSANQVTFKGLQKLSLNDIQNITKKDIYNQSLTENDINMMLKELYDNDLIDDVFFQKINDQYIIEIIENVLIENIYINGNIKIKDDPILANINNKRNFLFKKKLLTDDINIIKNIYKNIGYNNAIVTITTEKYSKNRINLIYNIDENKNTKISDIKFYGNNNFSDNFFYSLINSKATGFITIFSTGSKLNKEIFNFDKSKIEKFYKQKGFFDIKVSYELVERSLQNYELLFYISEGERYVIDNINYNLNSLSQNKNIIKELDNFNKKIESIDYYFDYKIVNDHLINLENIYVENNLIDYQIEYKLNLLNKKTNLSFDEKKVKPNIINKVDIYGLSITKEKTIRSKIELEPGDYFNQNILNRSTSNISRLKYINKVNVKKVTKDDNIDLIFNLNENKKTGNFLLGGSFSGDTGLGFGLNLKDNNLFGSGNELNFSGSADDEKIRFNIAYSFYLSKLPSLKNTISVFDEEKDLTSSFGYKTRNTGLDYSLSYTLNEKTSFFIGMNYENVNGNSASSNQSYVTDNIGDFNNFLIDVGFNNIDTNDILYPTSGYSNRFSITFSPEELSDDPFYRLVFKNAFYFDREYSKNFYFIQNYIGLAESFDDKLKTANAFSLGGLNFKGFLFRGIGPELNDIYLGGNKTFSSTVGYGNSFIFDNKDNINYKLFYSLGSIWDSDYTNDDFNLRSSIGISFDFITQVGPLSFSYAIPLEKEDSDKEKRFNFSIGTSF